MYYKIRVEDGECNDEGEAESRFALVKYTFHKELFELLFKFDVSCIDFCELYIIIITLKNEIFIFKNEDGYDEIRSFELKDKTYIPKKLLFNDTDYKIHILGSVNNYEIYNLDLSSCSPTNLIEFYRENNVCEMFLNRKLKKSILITRNGEIKLLNNDNCKSELLTRVGNELENSNINLVWAEKGRYIIWSINYELFVYYTNTGTVVKLNLNNFFRDKGEYLNNSKLNLYYKSKHIYFLIHNMIYLLEIKNELGNNIDSRNAYVNKGDSSLYNVKLIYMLDSSYSIIDASEMYSNLFNSKYTYVIAILGNSKDQLSVFTFDLLFRLIKHDKIHCKKYKYHIENKNFPEPTNKEYVDLQLSENRPRFLKNGKGQLLIHKNKNKSYLIMDHVSQEDFLLYKIKSGKLSDNIFGLFNGKLNKEFKMYLIIKYINTEKRNVSFELLDYILHTYSENENIFEFDVLVDIFSYHGILTEFIHYVNRSTYFLKLYKNIKSNEWHFSFLKFIMTKDASLFYYVINNFPVKELFFGHILKKKLYLHLISYMENRNNNINKYFNCECMEINKHCDNLFETRNKQDVVTNYNNYHFYLSYIILLSWNDVKVDKLLKYCFHLMGDFLSIKPIQDTILKSFDDLAHENVVNIKDFIINNIYCILNTQDNEIIERILSKNIAGEYEYYYNMLSNNEHYLFIFIKHLKAKYDCQKNIINMVDNNFSVGLSCTRNSSAFEVIELLSKNSIKITELYLNSSSHLLLDHIIDNYNSLDYGVVLELLDDRIKRIDCKSSDKYFYIITEAKSIILYLIGEKTNAISLLVNNGLIYSGLSLILYFSAENDNMIYYLIKMIVENNMRYLQDLLSWYDYFIYNPTGELSETRDYLKGIIFPKSSYYFNIVSKQNNSDGINNCCTWHSIAFNSKYICRINSDNIKNILATILNNIETDLDEGENNINCCNNNVIIPKMNVHEQYLKIQLNLSTCYWNYYNGLMNNRILNFIGHISKASIVDINKETCSLCNLKLFYHNNEKVSNKVIINNCSHNYHHGCLVKMSNLNEKSRKFKVDIDRNISKNYFRCVICKFHGMHS